MAMRAARPFSPVSPCMEAIYDTAARRLRIPPVHLDTRHTDRAELLQVSLHRDAATELVPCASSMLIHSRGT